MNLFRRSTILTVFIAAALSVAFTSTARSHYVFETTFYAVGDNPNAHPNQAFDGCIDARAEISHGSGGGYYK